MTALREARAYRRPTPAERSNPELGDLYHLERKVHELTWMSRHARTEAARFARDANREKNPSTRALFAQSAKEYENLALHYQEQATQLRTERGQLVSGLAHREE